MTKRSPLNGFRCYAELAQRYTEGVDYAVQVMPREQSQVAVLAPHGGRIEGRTSEVARLIAGDEHGLYLNICNRGRSGEGVQLELSEGLRKAGDWAGLAGAVRVVLEDLDGHSAE